MPQSSQVKEYSNGEVTVIWKPDVCIHSEKCWHGLPAVFNPKAKPWINAEGAPTQQIVDQVKKCPSGALSYRMANESSADESTEDLTQVEVIPNGPLMVPGPITLKDADGEQTIERPKVFLCRCGHSSNKPFCDGAHKKIGFEAP